MYEQVWYVAPPWLSNFLSLLVWGPLGGVLVAFLLFRFARWFPAKRSLTDARYVPLSIDVINIAELRVIGGAGLALVGVCVLVAIEMPSIGVPLGIGFVVSLITATLVILRRRKTGSFWSSNRALGASTMLRLDEPDAGPGSDSGKQK